MQDDLKSSAVPPDADVKTASHDHMNGPGMTNGVPDQLGEAQAKGSPRDERQAAETAATEPGEDGGSGS